MGRGRLETPNPTPLPPLLQLPMVSQHKKLYQHIIHLQLKRVSCPACWYISQKVTKVVHLYACMTVHTDDRVVVCSENTLGVANGDGVSDWDSHHTPETSNPEHFSAGMSARLSVVKMPYIWMGRWRGFQNEALASTLGVPNTWPINCIAVRALQGCYCHQITKEGEKLGFCSDLPGFRI